MDDPLYNFQFRLILIGDSTVGKSSLLRYFSDGKFAELSDPTVGVDFFTRLVTLKCGARVKLQLWDTAGQERFRSITKSYYRNSVGAVLAYDVCNMDSFKNIPRWLHEARRHIEPQQATFIMVGCKTDLAVGNNREVTKQQGQDLADYHNIAFLETSAKLGVNVEEAFLTISEEIYAKLERGEYRIEEGWDGIKMGYMQRTDFRERTGTVLPPSLVEAQPAHTSCC